MPILIACPSCAAKLRTPDSMAGRKITCPRCSTAFGVPSQATLETTCFLARPQFVDLVDVEAVPAPTFSQTEDDFDFPAPRRNYRNRKHGSSWTGIMVGVCVGIVMTLGGILWIKGSLSKSGSQEVIKAVDRLLEGDDLIG